MMNMEKSIAQTRTMIRERAPRISEERAHVKAEGTAVGKLAAGVGALLVLAAAASLLVALLLELDIGIMLVAALVLIGGIGLVLLFLGASLISRDAAPIIAKLGEWIVNLIRAGRGKNST